MSTLNDYVINVGPTWDDLTPRATSDSKEEAIKIAKLYHDKCLEVVYSPCNDVDVNEVVWSNRKKGEVHFQKYEIKSEE